MAVSKEVFDKYSYLLKDDKYQEFFDKLPESDRKDYAEFIYFTAGVDFIKYMNHIPKRLLYGSTKFKQLNLDVESIDDEAFADSDLVEVKINEGCQKIGKGAFANCQSLDIVAIGNGPRVLESNTFSNCPILRKVYLPNSVTVLKKDVFANSDNVQIITSLKDRSRMERLSIPTSEKDFYKAHMRVPKSQPQQQGE